MSVIKSLHADLLSGKTTARALAQNYLDVIKEKEQDINAFISVDDDAVLTHAEDVDAKIARGEKIDVLAGIPGGLKDLISVRGGRTTAGSKMLENFTAVYDATVTTRLKERDALVLGKTNLDEFACGGSTEYSAFGVTKNPHDNTRVAGGSSGGSAAAVASGEVVWALGTDTGGSIRQPSSFCGVVGLKPTYGRVSRYGVIAMASSLDQVGPIATTVEDVAIILTRIAGHDPQDATSAHSSDRVYEDYLSGDIRGAKIGIPKEFLHSDLDADVRRVFDEAVARYESLGAEIVEISLPHTEFALAAYYIIMPAELSSNLARYDGLRYGYAIDEKMDVQDYYKKVRSTAFGAEIKRRLMLGTYTLSAGYYDAYYKKAQKVRALIRRDYEKAFEKVDYIFTPTAPEVAFKIGAKTADPLTMYLADIFTVPINLAGVPALSHPIGTIAKDGVDLPIGGQLIGKWFDEEGILNAAFAYEQQTQ